MDLNCGKERFYGRCSMGKRLSWEDIVALYPAQYVYLTDIVWLNDRGQDVQSAVVIHATERNDDVEYINRSVKGECVERYTDIENMTPMGFLTV